MPEVFQDNMTLYMAVLGWLVPMLVSFVNQRGWTSEMKGVVAALVSIGTAAIATALSGNWDGQDMVRNILIVLTLSQISYQTFWRPSHIGPTIEGKTSVQDE